MLDRLPLAMTASLLLVLAQVASADNHPQSKASHDAILILDGSGSMWGQIDGVNKIVIAKDVVEGLVLSLPTEQRLGFVAYGHRNKGDCDDIETLADVGAPRAELINALREISPKGKTPLTASLMHAAETLNYKKNAANIILVSDGLETCDADPCELARVLEANGLDLTVHVVGFDVTEQERRGLVCIADETGGQFVAADSADELADALAVVAEAGSVPSDAVVSTPAPSTLALKATILADGPLIQQQLDWRVISSTGEVVFEKSGTGSESTEVVPGDYRAEVAWQGWQGGETRWGSLEFSVRPQQPKVVTVPVDLELPVVLEAPSQTAEGVPVKVRWSGPDDLGAFVYVSGVEDDPRTYVYGHPATRARDAYAKGKNLDEIDTNGDGVFGVEDLATTEIGGPSVAGDYEVRYVLDRPRVVLARSPLQVTDSSYVLSAPEKVSMSTRFEVEWGGPETPGDFLTIIKAGSQSAFERGWTKPVAKTEGKVTLLSPAVPGQYEIRYVLANGYTLYPGMQAAVQTSIPIEVEAVTAQVSGPASATGGSTIEVSVEKPGGWQDDFVSVIEPGAEKYNRDSWDRLFHRGEARDPVTIQVPNVPGEYELVYVLEPGGRIMHRQPLTINLADASVDAPDSVVAGSDFTVDFQGPAYKGDRVVVAPAGTADSKMWSYTPRYGFIVKAGAASGTVKAFAIAAGPGEYEVRYVTGLQHVVLARDKFTVTE